MTQSKRDDLLSVRFPPHSPLRKALETRVEDYFHTTGRSRQGGGRLVVKSAVILAWFAASWAFLVFWADTPWTAVPLAISLGLAAAAIGFNVQHDGGHDAFAASRRWNRIAAYALDLVGGSSYVWRFKHSVIHHHYTNIDGVDDDIDAAPFLRLAPDQPRRPWHRLQHWYAWALFGFLPPKWALYDDFKALARGRIGSQPLPRPGALDLALLLAGKAAHVAWTFAIPLAVGHPFGRVLGYYAIFAVVTGVCISVVFQLAHCVEEAAFLPVPSGGGRVERPWAEHQLATTVDFAPRNPVLTWYLGGLNFQVEHHLFPHVSHVHYASLAPLVRETCAAHGVEHRSHPGFFGALRSHVRHLQRLGRPA